MATPSTTLPMISPDGKVGDIPVEQADNAEKAGFKRAVDMVSPTGQHGAIPVENAEAAQANGFRIGRPNVNPPPVDVLDSPKAQEIEQAGVNAGKFGADALMGGTIAKAGIGAAKAGIAALTAPSAGATSTVGTGLVDAAGKEITRDVVGAGPSIVGKTMEVYAKAKPYLEGLEKLGIGAGGVGYILKLLHDASHGTK